MNVPHKPQSAVGLLRVNMPSHHLLVLLLAALTATADDIAEKDAELLTEKGGVAANGKESEAYSYGGGGGGWDGGWNAEVAPAGVVRTRVTVQKRILQPVVRKHHHHKHHHYSPPVVVQQPAVVAAVDPLGGFEGSYVAVSGRPGERTVHAVNGVGSVAIEPAVPAVLLGRGHGLGVDYEDDSFLLGGGGVGLAGRGGLPKCSYLDTDFEGDDVGDGRGLTTGSAYACKQACIDQGQCQFWTFRANWARDCYLKRGNGRGDVNPENATPKAGFVSGTVGRKCVCLSSSGDQICPVRRSEGRGYRRNLGPRFDYDDDDDDEDDNDDDDRGDKEVATKNRADGDDKKDADGGNADADGADNGGNSTTRRRGGNRNTNSGSRRRNRNRGNNRNNNNDNLEVEEVELDEESL